MRIKFSRARISWSPLPGESWHLRWRYMIPIRLPWRPRARPSATLHEIPVCSVKSKLGKIVQPTTWSVKSDFVTRTPSCLLNVCPHMLASACRFTRRRLPSATKMLQDATRDRDDSTTHYVLPSARSHACRVRTRCPTRAPLIRLLPRHHAHPNRRKAG